ncbi:MAG TPA: NmrA family NAD(P)-binding protein [Oxalicibacterium sp.]|uniref:NmrA family NAD(P)-binding protein n=1 Tax=Oxalicibacterium sp. TaxID=2766525 RepID=UPI002BD2E184|nr:NmrA family NAD(P)-binding protein [Oxalicibacterium sp.]HWU98498.1 NmrA family NAD(P)-binding protein [Oxalicibacterium sp.]
MYAITAVTGQVGGVVARTLLADGKEVRAIVRNAEKGKAWAAQGCEVALAEMDDTVALQKAFTGAEAVFILLPPTFDPSPDFAEARRTIASIRNALEAARPARVVCLSTIGANATQPNLLNQLGMLEKELRTLPMPVTFLRPGWFMENAAWDVASARETGVIHTFLQPLDKPVPMVATADVGRVAAELLQQAGEGVRIVDLEGPWRVTPKEIGATFSKLLGKPVRMEIVPRETWQGLFESQGMENPMPRIQMIDGFNEGWIEFESGQAGSRKGTTTLATVYQNLIQKGY